MKLYKIVILFLIISCFSAQETESVYVLNNRTKIVQNRITRKFEIRKYDRVKGQYKATLKKIKFVKMLSSEYFQILNKRNEINYVNENGDLTNLPKIAPFVCGTVNTYKMRVIENMNHYEVVSKNIGMGTIPEAYIKEEKIQIISKQIADSIFFINGKSEFSYDDNFYFLTNINPKTIVLKKNSKFFTYENQNNKYDEITFGQYDRLLITKSNNLYGILNVIEPKYLKINPFEHYLAKVELSNKKIIFIDKEGNEYQ